MIDYTKTKIYKIWSHLGDKLYIGSTTKNYLSERMAYHRSDYKQWKKNNARDRISSCDLFEEYGIGNCKIELLEVTPCNSKDESKKLEGKYIRELICVNRILPDRTKEERINMVKEYQQDNKEKIAEYQKEYRKNKTIILHYPKKK